MIDLQGRMNRSSNARQCSAAACRTCGSGGRIAPGARGELAVRCGDRHRQISAAASQPARTSTSWASDHRLQIPGHQVVAGSHPQVVQAACRAFRRGRTAWCAVVIDVLGVVLHHGFQGHGQAGGRLLRGGAVRPRSRQQAETAPRRRVLPAAACRYASTPWWRIARRLPRIMNCWVKRSWP